VGDLALVWSPERGNADLVIATSLDDLAADDGLGTSLFLSLFTDRRAEDDDRLPSDDGDRRGWWADEFAEVPGDRFGSRLWLLDRSVRTPDVLPLAEQYVREAVAWLIADRVTERIDVSVSFQGAWMLHRVEVYRPTGDPARYLFAQPWDAMAAGTDAG